MLVDNDGKISFDKEEEDYIINKLAKLIKANVYFQAEYNAKQWLEDVKKKNRAHYFDSNSEINIPFNVHFSGEVLTTLIAERELESKDASEFSTDILDKFEKLKKNKSKSKWWRFKK